MAQEPSNPSTTPDTPETGGANSERTKIISDEGKTIIAGTVRGKIIYPADTANITTAVQVADEEYTQIANISEESQTAPEFWAALQDNGNRTDYSYAFANWSSSVIAPLFPLNNIDKCMYALMNCTKLEDARSITFNITNNSPNMMYVCANCTSMTNAPQFIYNNVPIVKTYTSMYASCAALKTVQVYWGDGTADPVTQRNSCQNMFFKCSNLTDINFGANKTGSPIYLDLSYSNKITLATMKSLANSLQDVSKAASGNYDITINSATLTLLTDDVKNIFTDKGWVLKTK